MDDTLNFGMWWEMQEKNVPLHISRVCVKDFARAAWTAAKSYYSPSIHAPRLAVEQAAEKMAEAADEVIIANGCGSPELFDRALGKLRAYLAAYRKLVLAEKKE